MDLTHFRSFLAVADLGSVSAAAAEVLGISQSALSRRLQLLQEDFGTELVERSGRGVAFTEMGRLVEAEARILVERYDRLKEDVARHVRLDAGVVRVGGGATAVSYVLPRAILKFQKAHPEVRFEVREAGSRDVEHAVRSGTLELGLVTLPITKEDLVVQQLLKDKIVLVAGRGHPLARRKRVAIKDLSGQNVVGFEAGTAIRHLIDAALREARVSVNVVMELRSIAAILRMVETTGSLAFVSEMGASGARVVPVSGLRVERQLALIYRADRSLSPAATAFAEGILSAVRG